MFIPLPPHPELENHSPQTTHTLHPSPSKKAEIGRSLFAPISTPHSTCPISQPRRRKNPHYTAEHPPIHRLIYPSFPQVSKNLCVFFFWLKSCRDSGYLCSCQVDRVVYGFGEHDSTKEDSNSISYIFITMQGVTLVFKNPKSCFFFSSSPYSAGVPCFTLAQVKPPRYFG